MKTSIVFISSLVFLLLLNSPATLAAPKREADDNLTHTLAIQRKSQVQSVDYDLHFYFNPKSDQLKGTATLNLSLKKTSEPLSLDFFEGKINELRVNNQVVGRFPQRKGSFDIPAKFLKLQTQIVIEFTAPYGKEGHGIQKVVDPEDNAVYIFTDLEPYQAHQFFPCFDQPDLKATFSLKVTAPGSWKVIGNEIIQKTQVVGDFAETTFHKTPRISTYLFFVGAGDFVEWKDSAGKIPLELYARKSLAKFVDAPRLFETTKKGLSFFNEYFGVPYPFSKYGQVFVPEFTWGGMENPGAVTLNEMNIFRGDEGRSRYENRDNLILHEMAHMWFGDLVTMQWWDDLWLNESFADFMADLANVHAMNSQGGMIKAIQDKSWAYWQDQLVTTHPIETKVVDTRSAQGNFDGITYAKGGASLKQLHFLIGDKAFRAGLKNYFEKFSFANATRADFVRELSSAAGIDLIPWTQSWLQTAGPHRVATLWTCEEDKLTEFKVTQAPNKGGVFSPHKTKIGLFKSDGEKLKSYLVQDVSYSKKETVVAELVGKRCPDFVFPNIEDKDYALFSFDEKSAKYVRQVLTGAVDDAMTRMGTWQMLYQMVRDRQLSPMEFFDIVVAAVETEKDENLLPVIFGRGPMVDYFQNLLQTEQKNQVARKLEFAVLKRLAESKPESNTQKTFFDFFVRMAHTPEALGNLKDFLAEVGLPKGFKLDQDRRWNILERLSMYGLPQIGDRVAQELKKDPSKTGMRKAFSASVAIPNQEVKKKFWQLLDKPHSLPFSHLTSGAEEFNNANHPQLSEMFVKPFFERVRKMNWRDNDSLVDLYFRNLFPSSLCNRKFLEESEKNLKQSKNLTALARRAWLEANDDLSVCVAIREKYHTTGLN